MDFVQTVRKKVLHIWHMIDSEGRVNEFKFYHANECVG